MSETIRSGCRIVFEDGEVDTIWSVGRGKEPEKVTVSGRAAYTGGPEPDQALRDHLRSSAEQKIYEQNN